MGRPDGVWLPPSPAPQAPSAREPGQSPAKEESEVYVVELATNFGRIWTSKPSVAPDGLVSVLRNPKRARSGSGGVLAPTNFTGVAFSALADTLATVDNYGNLFLFHIRQ